VLLPILLFPNLLFPILLFPLNCRVSIEEAQKSLDGWYSDRPEVKDWQARMIAYAEATGYTRTLLGRYRPVKSKAR
jgi:DNA polymerase I-like protein with 3'-5' exonuclease and polymerase domains